MRLSGDISLHASRPYQRRMRSYLLWSTFSACCLALAGYPCVGVDRTWNEAIIEGEDDMMDMVKQVPAFWISEVDFLRSRDGRMKTSG